VGPAHGDGELGEEIDGIPVVSVLRDRSEQGAYLVALADGRYAVMSTGLVAIGGRRALAGWCEGRAERPEVDAAERAWWQEVTGALIARGRSGGSGGISDLGVSGGRVVGSEDS
jgi:hypothetical protein